MWWIRVCNERFYGQFSDCDLCRSGIQRHTVVLMLLADGDISSLCFYIILGFKLSSRNLHCVPVIVDYIGSKPASMTPFMYQKTISLTFSVLVSIQNLRVSSVKDKNSLNCLIWGWTWCAHNSLPVTVFHETHHPLLYSGSKRSSICEAALLYFMYQLMQHSVNKYLD
jgi:hypothetical protein